MFSAYLLVALAAQALDEPVIVGTELAGRDQVVVREALLFPLQAQHVHGSSLVQLPNGDLLAAWFQGSGERRADDVQILGARLPADGQVLE